MASGPPGRSGPTAPGPAVEESCSGSAPAAAPGMHTCKHTILYQSTQSNPIVPNRWQKGYTLSSAAENSSRTSSLDNNLSRKKSTCLKNASSQSTWEHCLPGCCQHRRVHTLRGLHTLVIMSLIFQTDSPDRQTILWHEPDEGKKKPKKLLIAPLSESCQDSRQTSPIAAHSHKHNST